MKKISIITLTLCMILTMVSCKKTTTVSGGSWSFKSNTYKVTSGITNTADNAFVVVSKDGNKYDQLLFTFTTLPSADGSYTIVSGAPDSTGTQVQLSLTLATAPSYASTMYVPNAAGNATVTVSGGIMKVQLPTLDVVNAADATDHSDLTGTVNQTEK